MDMRWPWPLIVVLTVAAVASGCGGTDAESARDEAKHNAWKKGYIEYDDELAYKWDNSVCDSSSSGCWGMRVVTKNGCEYLYVELQVVNLMGNVDGTKNAIAEHLAAGEVARLDFAEFGSHYGYKAALDHMSCY